MSAKVVKFSDDARGRMLSGVNVLADAAWSKRSKCGSAKELWRSSCY